MNEIRSELPRRLYRADQVRELDRIAIEERGIPGIQLMERAGKAVFEVLLSYWPQAKNILVVCGGGNNAGDGYIVARLAAEQNINCDVIALTDPASLKGDAKLAADDWLATGNSNKPYAEDLISQADVIVDALLGTGLDREVAGSYDELISTINRVNKPVLAVDIPSGLNADNGQVMGSAIKADVTVTFIGLKRGMFTGDGPQHSGSILFSDLGVPVDIYSDIPNEIERLQSQDVSRFLAPRPRNSHKGDFGYALLIGGDYGMAGAIRMAAEAAGRVGAGLISIATRPEHAISIPLVRPELMSRAIDSPTDLIPMIDKANVIAIGPGLGQSEWAQLLLSKVLETELPLVLDADALNLLALEPFCSDRWILTPHPGEAARLLNTTTIEIQQDRYAAARELQEKYGGTIVLKGSGTIVADNDGMFVCTAGNPGMASGGMGDVLTGVITGLVAQGLALSDAAKLGVSLHAQAGDAAAEAGERGMLATDLLPFLRALVNP